LIVFDEKIYAENMIKKGFHTKNKNVYELHILAKYYFYIGKEKEVVKDLLIKFCEKHIEYFNIDEWYGVINRTISVANKGHLVTGKSVDITKNELETIQQLEDIREQKLAFTMMVLYKFYDCKRFKVTIKDLFELSDVTTINTDTKLKLLHSLTFKGLIDIDMRGRRWVKFSNENNKVEIKINNFEQFIYEYYLYTGFKDFTNCIICNKAIKKSINCIKKYCNKCSEEERRKRQKKYMQSRRKTC